MQKRRNGKPVKIVKRVRKTNMIEQWDNRVCSANNKAVRMQSFPSWSAQNINDQIPRCYPLHPDLEFYFELKNRLEKAVPSYAPEDR